MNEFGEKLLQEIRSDRGYTLPMHRVLAERHPEFLDGYNRMFTSAMNSESPLPAYVRELLVMALDIAVGAKPEVARGHARKAIEHGATEAQVLAAVELTTIVFSGRGMGALVGLFED
jgi:alkylhydroperoxidase/carboxymuconolactone decarboxylase family protein YurZ